MAQLALSPDGQRVAVRSDESGNSDVWVHDLTRATNTRLTFDEQTEFQPAWSPSGTEIVYCKGTSLMRKAADGTGEAVALLQAKNAVYWPNWSRDGRYLVYEEGSPDTGRDIRYVDLGANGVAGEPVTLLGSPAAERFPNISPNGRFLAYASGESGRSEVYVRPFPSGTGRWQVSLTGGVFPRWRGDGRELYYVGNDMLIAVPVSSDSALTLGQPQTLFEAAGVSPAAQGARGYDVSADGQRFLTIMPVEGNEQTASPKIRIVQNWHEEFRDRK
jgi:Tol biopolymer transport system component